MIDRRLFVKSASVSSLLATGCVTGEQIKPAPPPPTRVFVEPFAKIPYWIDYGRRIIVKGSINGDPSQDFIVDTAATSSILFANAARNKPFTLSGRPNINLIGFGGVQNVPTYNIGVLEAGGVSLTNHIAPILPDWNDFERTPQGILGLDFFEGLLCIINPFTFQIEIYRADPADVEALQSRWRSVPLMNSSLDISTRPFLLVEVLIAKKSIPFLLDTGSSSTLCNFPAIEALQTIPPIEVPNRPSELVSDIHSETISAYLLRKYGLNLSGIRLDAKPMLIADTPFFDEIGFRDRPFGVLGLNHLLQQSIAIDFVNNRLFIKTA